MVIKQLSYLLVLILAVSCNVRQNTNSKAKEGNTPTEETISKVPDDKKPETPSEQDLSRERIHFLGHNILYGEDLLKEFEKISSEDENIGYDTEKENLTIYGTTFHVNSYPGRTDFMLMSSVEPDSRQMKIVIEAFSKYHGKKETIEPDHYAWSYGRRCPNLIYPSLRLRRVRSDFGGTTIMVSIY